jgi:hypothetical protein
LILFNFFLKVTKDAEFAGGAKWPTSLLTNAIVIIIQYCTQSLLKCQYLPQEGKRHDPLILQANFSYESHLLNLNIFQFFRLLFHLKSKRFTSFQSASEEY